LNLLIIRWSPLLVAFSQSTKFVTVMSTDIKFKIWNTIQVFPIIHILKHALYQTPSSLIFFLFFPPKRFWKPDFSQRGGNPYGVQFLVYILTTLTRLVITRPSFIIGLWIPKGILLTRPPFFPLFLKERHAISFLSQ